MTDLAQAFINTGLCILCCWNIIDHIRLRRRVEQLEAAADDRQWSRFSTQSAETGDSVSRLSSLAPATPKILIDEKQS